ncbi:hypothetical protein BpHYR1_046031 [Brachionus plicatilis]|uniref:Uncharacterized protein n=1 Tax=Brachionus plicatilis TaxID=10195 RepID=A0A3M7SC49_BRAPC|nr:hypothetical protein BpHYR1_046031 [Brachionus plicatilis]
MMVNQGDCKKKRDLSLTGYGAITFLIREPLFEKKISTIVLLLSINASSNYDLDNLIYKI